MPNISPTLIQAGTPIVALFIAECCGQARTSPKEAGVPTLFLYQMFVAWKIHRGINDPFCNNRNLFSAFLKHVNPNTHGVQSVYVTKKTRRQISCANVYRLSLPTVVETAFPIFGTDGRPLTSASGPYLLKSSDVSPKALAEMEYVDRYNSGEDMRGRYARP